MKSEKEIKEFLSNLKYWSFCINNQYYPISTDVTIKALKWVLEDEEI